MPERGLMEILLGAGALVGASVWGFWQARRVAKIADERSRKQIEPIAKEVSGPEGEPGLRELVKSVAADVRGVKDATQVNSQGLIGLHLKVDSMEGRLSRRMDDSDARLATEVGMLTGHVQSLSGRVDKVEGLGKEVVDLRARVETAGALRSKDIRMSGAAMGSTEVTEEGQGPAGAGADRPEILAPTPPRRGV